MVISQIAMRNLCFKVSGKRYNKSVDLILKLDYIGINNYIMQCETEVTKDFSSVTRKFKQEIMFDVRRKEETIDNCVSFGPFLIEILSEFHEIVAGEREDFDLNSLLTTVLKSGNFKYNSDILDDVIRDIPILEPQLNAWSGGVYIEKCIRDNLMYEFEYTPCCMGFKGKATGKLLTLDFILE